MATYEEITAKEAQERLGEFFAVDVRGEQEFNGPLGHVGGSVLAPLGELDEHAKALPVDRPLLLVCRSGNRSGKACARLMELGISNVVNLAGGMIDWNRAGLPIECDEPASLGELLEALVAWMTMVGSLEPAGAREVLERRLETLGASYAHPTHASVDQLLMFVEESLAQSGLPDLDLSLAAFRRALSVL